MSEKAFTSGMTDEPGDVKTQIKKIGRNTSTTSGARPFQRHLDTNMRRQVGLALRIAVEIELIAKIP